LVQAGHRPDLGVEVEEFVITDASSSFLPVAAYHHLNHADSVKEFYFVLIKGEKGE
jgi:hypothetical protein